MKNLIILVFSSTGEVEEFDHSTQTHTRYWVEEQTIRSKSGAFQPGMLQKFKNPYEVEVREGAISLQKIEEIVYDHHDFVERENSATVVNPRLERR